MTEPLQMLKLLADDTRWRLIHDLRLSDRQVGELVARTGLSQNLVSYHLNLLRQAGLVQVRRSDADARATYYGLVASALQAAYQQIGASLQLTNPLPPADLPAVPVIFLCTANSARSQMAEGWLRHLSGGRVPVWSAGTQPAPVHPLAVQVMAEAGVDISTQRAKEVAALDDIVPGVVITVCDLAREACQPCLDAAVQLHWSIPDPVPATSSPDEQIAVFRAARDELQRRVTGLLTMLPSLAKDESKK